MPTLVFDDGSVDIARDHFLESIGSLAEGDYHLARVLVGLHYGGFCDVDGDMTRPPDERALGRISQLVDQSHWGKIVINYVR